MSRDLITIAIPRNYKAAVKALRNTLKQNQLSPNIVDTESPRDILQTLFPEDTSDKTLKKARATVTRLVEQLEVIARLQVSANFGASDIDLLHKLFGEEHKLILSELVKQRLNGYYFLPAITPQPDANHGFVTLLREVTPLPHGVANGVASGMEMHEFKALCASHPLYQGSLAFDKEDYAYPVGQVRSPELEHLMQTFMMLFGRIGVEELPRDYCAQLEGHHIPNAR